MQEGRVTRVYRLASMHTCVGLEALDDKQYSELLVEGSETTDIPQQ